MGIEFIYDKNQLTTIDEISVSVADLRDLVQALNIQNEAQRLHELKTILAGVVRKNRLLPGAVGVSDPVEAHSADAGPGLIA